MPSQGGRRLEILIPKQFPARVDIMLADLEYEFRRIKIECPACGKEQFVRLRAEGMATKQGIMSLVIRAACDHEFHLYLDKSYKVRGYEKVDMIVASEMMQVDDAISSFMKDQGMKESAESMKNGKVRNEFDRERFLETFIKFYQGVDTSYTYFPPALKGGSGAAKEKSLPVVEPASLAQVPIAQLPEPAISVQETDHDVESELDQPANERMIEIPAPAIPLDIEQTKEITEEPPDETSEMEIPFETIKVQYEDRIKKINEIMINLELQNLDESMDDIELIKKKAKLQKIRETLEAQFNKLIEDHGVKKEDFTVEDTKSQFKERIKKISQVMINLELQNLNEAVSDVEFEKKKVKLEQIRDDLKAQYNKFLDDHGLEHVDLEDAEPADV